MAAGLAVVDDVGAIVPVLLDVDVGAIMLVLLDVDVELVVVGVSVILK